MKIAKTISLADKFKQDMTFAEKKRKEREAHYRCVYSYWRKDTKEMTDNLLMLPYADEAQNRAVFERHIVGMIVRGFKDEGTWRFVEDMKNIEVRYLGVYDKMKNQWFKKASVDGEIVLDCRKFINDSVDALAELNKKEVKI